MRKFWDTMSSGWDPKSPQDSKAYSQMKFESAFDEGWNSWGSAAFKGGMKYLGPPAIIAGAIGGAAALNNYHAADPKFTNPIVGGIIGATAGFTLAPMLASRMNLAPQYAKLARPALAGIGAGGGLYTGASIGVGMSVGQHYGPMAGIAAGVGLLAGPALGAGIFGRTISQAAKTGTMGQLGASMLSGVTGKLGPAALKVGVALGGSLWNAAKGSEFVARTLFTGGTKGVSRNAVDAWFPNYRQTPLKVGGLVDPRKFMPNPRVVRRATGLMALGSLGAGALEAMNTSAAPPTAYFDGRSMRHINDMGAGANYASAVLGPNSGVNISNAEWGRIAAQVF